ncbi:choice-of-anchor D domain-containing protein [Roseateles sp. BYS78W]|uniref:Choice-of-anchor D domain-containing protein n=1 Tax=Pelomonas candidula TaxID=3299025 RepID=A0ABW7H8I2_9BURK
MPFRLRPSPAHLHGHRNRLQRWAPRLTTLLALLALALAMLLALTVPGLAHAADALAGKTLYQSGNSTAQACALCHGTNPSQNISRILLGANNPTLITQAINNNTGGMGIYKNKLTSTDIDNIAAYLANPSVTAAPAISVTPTSLSFATTTVGASTSGSVVVSNTGTAALTLSAISLSGTAAASYALGTGSSACAAGGSVAAGASCTVYVTFKPQAAGTLAASLVLTHNASGGSTTVALSGTGSAVPAPVIALSASTLDLGSSVVGTAAAAKSVTVSNTGTAALNFSALTLGGSDASAFSLTGSCAVGQAVAAGASCTLTLGFTPSRIGTHSASLSIASNASNGAQTLTLAGTGTAVPAPVAARSPATIAFGNVTINTAAAAQVVTWSNTGTAAMTLGTPTLAGASAFTLASNGCGTTLAAGASCTLGLAYTPTAIGSDTATLSLPSNGSSAALTVALSGSGIAVPVATPVLSDSGTISFADTLTGQSSATHTTTLSNTGNTAFTISSLSLSAGSTVDFQLAGTCATGGSVAAGGSCSIVTSFAPVEPGSPLTATLSLQTNTGASYALTLSGNAVATGAPQLTLTPATQDFGSVTVAQASGVQRLTLSNPGTQEATVSSLSFSSSVFALSTTTSGDCSAAPFTLLPGKGCTLPVVATPTATGSASGTLTAKGSGPAGNAVALTASATLSVTGTAAATSNSSGSSGGGGCTATTSGRDASLPLLLAGAIVTGLWRRRRQALQRAGGALALALAVAAPSARALDVGAQPPGLDLPGLNGERVTLAQYRGKVVWLDFWASWCGPCKQSFGWMNDMQARYAAAGLQVLAVNVDARSADAQKFLAEHPAQFAVALDANGATPRSFQVKGMPTSVLIGPDGRVIAVHQGFREAERAELEQQIRQAIGATR